MSQDINSLINSLSKFAEDSEKLFLPTISCKLASAKHTYPEDQTIGMIAGVISRMTGNNKIEMSRAEFKDLYEKFYTRNNKFVSVFANELGKREEANINTDQPVEDGSLLSLNIETDPMIAEVAAHAFGEVRRFYSKKSAQKAIDICKQEFGLMRLPIRASVVNGSPDIILCLASFETPKGETSVLIPIDVIEENVITPNIFVGNDGPEELTRDNVIAYVIKNSGKILKMSHKEVMEAALHIKGSSNIGSVDLAVIKLANSGKEEELIGQQILGQTIETENPNLILDMPVYESKEMESIATQFDSALGIAIHTFGDGAIRSGRGMIERVVASCGATSNIAIVASDDNTITYAVSVNGGSAGFKVPVRIESNLAFPPDTFICAGSIRAFDRQNVFNAISSNKFDKQAAVSASPLYGLKPAELVSIVRAAVEEENYVKAEDAINILSEMEDTKAYGIALAAFSNGLLKKEAAPTQKCSMIVQSKHSQHDLCGHTGLPLHKVFQNKNNECLPIYRQSMSEDYESALFTNSKIFF